MRLQNLFTDDDAVSPVIGVILMVAITVILAAVIASFVLGLGNQTGNVAPQASFSIEYESNTWTHSGLAGDWDGNLTVTHDSGDPIPQGELYLRGSNFMVDSATNRSWQGYVGSTNDSVVSVSASGSTEGRTAVVAGDALRIGTKSDYEVRVVWQSASGENSNTFREDTGPDA